MPKAECGFCRDCKWWDLEEKNDGTIGECLAMAFLGVGRPLHLTTKAKAGQPEGGTAWVRTMADFGCVQFEPKEASREG